MNTALVVPLNTAVVRRGAEAWKWLKANAKLSREKWREVGEALLVGRKLHPVDNNKFSEWCTANDFGDVPSKARTDAQWLAQEWEGVQTRRLDPDINHPTSVRDAYRKALKSPSDHPKFTRDDAEYALKIAALAERGVEGEKETAQAKLDRLAKGFGMSAEEMVSKSRGVCPEPTPMTPMEAGTQALMQPFQMMSKTALLAVLLRCFMTHPDLIGLHKEYK